MDIFIQPARQWPCARTVDGVDREFSRISRLQSLIESGTFGPALGSVHATQKKENETDRSRRGMYIRVIDVDGLRAVFDGESLVVDIDNVVA